MKKKLNIVFKRLSDQKNTISVKNVFLNICLLNTICLLGQNIGFSQFSVLNNFFFFFFPWEVTFIEFTEKAGHSQLFLFLSHTFSSSVLQCLLPAVCINLLFILNKTKIGWIYLESLVSPQFILLPFYNRIWAFFSTQKSCPQLQHKLVYSEEFPDRRTSGISKCVEMIKVKDVAGCFSWHFSPKEQSQWLPHL